MRKGDTTGPHRFYSEAQYFGRGAKSRCTNVDLFILTRMFDRIPRVSHTVSLCLDYMQIIKQIPERVSSPAIFGLRQKSSLTYSLDPKKQDR